MDTTVSGASFTLTTDLAFGEDDIWVRAIGVDDFPADWSESNRTIVSPELQATLTSTFNERPEIRWEGLPGAGSYQLFVANGNSVVINETGLTGTSYTPTEAFSCGKHRYWIRPTHTNGTQSAGSERGEFFIGGRTTVTAPTGTTTDGTPLVTWEAVDDAESYEVYLYHDDTETLNNRTGPAAGLSLETVPAPDEDYRVWGRSNPAGGGSGIWSGAHSFGVDSASITAAATPSAATGSTLDRTPTLAWTAPAEATGLDLYLTDGTSTIHESELTQSSWTPSSELAADHWKWWVRAKNAAGDSGPWSSPQSLDTAGRTAFVNLPETTTDRPPTFTWSPVDAVTHYQFQLDKLTTEVSSVIREDNVVGASLTPAESLTPGRYRAWVRATGEVTGLGTLPVDFEIV